MVERNIRREVVAVMSDGSDELRGDTLERKSIQFSWLLKERGLQDGDRVAIMMENSLTWLICMWGVRRSNMFFVPVNWHLTPREIRFIVENSGAKAIVTCAGLADRAAAAIAGLDAVETRLITSGAHDSFESLDQLLAAFPETHGPVEMDGAMMPYSSGTSGTPKGILRPLSGVPFGQLSEMEQAQQRLLGLDRNTVYLSPAPFYHSAPLSWSGSVILAGGKVVMMPSFDGAAALEAIEHHRVTHAQFVPTHFVRMLRARKEAARSFDLSSLTAVVHAAAPCPPEIKLEMIEWLGPIISEYYGGSERSGMTFIGSADWLAHRGSVGRSITSPIRIIDTEKGVVVPSGTVGQVYFERPAPFEYHGDSQKTAAAFNAQGWGTYGDLGHVDDEGYLYLADRRTDLIVSGGVNIYPREIEDLLIMHDDVADVAVVGVPDPEFGQSVKAVVQLRPGVGTPDAPALIAFCRAQLAGFKVPRSVDFTDALPRLPSGKLLRRVVAERYAKVEPQLTPHAASPKCDGTSAGPSA